MKSWLDDEEHARVIVDVRGQSYPSSEWSIANVAVGERTFVSIGITAMGCQAQVHGMTSVNLRKLAAYLLSCAEQAEAITAEYDRGVMSRSEAKP